jgi:hypothetical protein
LAYQSPASGTFLSEQISTSHQPNEQAGPISSSQNYSLIPPFSILPSLILLDLEPKSRTTRALFVWLISHQYFSLRTNQPPAINQQDFSLRINQHQPNEQAEEHFTN